MKIWHECDELKLNKTEDDDLQQFIFEFQPTGAKLRARCMALPRAGGRATAHSPLPT